ncbi:MAG: hypothetical protein V2A62_04935 [Candidatus Woesearchaeota archaeon]
MVKVFNTPVIGISELEQKQMLWLKEALATIQLINSNANNSLSAVQKKENTNNNLNKSLQMEKEISQRLAALERSALDYINLTKERENAQRLKNSLPFLNKYQIESFLNKISSYLQEGNFPLAIRTLEQELLDPNFGMLIGRYEHTKLVEQHLPEEERQDVLAYNNSLQRLKDFLTNTLTKNESAQFKEGVNGTELVQGLQNSIKNLLGKGFLFWKAGIVPEIEAYYEESNASLEVEVELLQSRQNALTRLEGGLMETAQAIFRLMEANVVYSPEQLEAAKEELAEIFVTFQTRAFNLIIPLSQRDALRSSLLNLNGYFNRSSKELENTLLPSDVPEFVFEFFATMEDLAKGAKQKADENDFREAVLRLEEMYRLNMRREWERLKKPSQSKICAVLLDRNNEIQELVQAVRSVVRNAEEREKYFLELILNLEQTNQLLATRRGLEQ